MSAPTTGTQEEEQAYVHNVIYKQWTMPQITNKSLHCLVKRQADERYNTKTPDSNQGGIAKYARCSIRRLIYHFRTNRFPSDTLAKSI